MEMYQRAFISVMFNINTVTASRLKEFRIPERPIGTYYFYDPPKIRIVNGTSIADVLF